MTGAFDGTYRFSGIYRNQWRSVTIPYNTLGISADASNFARVENMGAGFNLLFDQAGDSHFKTIQATVSLAWMYPFDRDKKEYLSFGFQGSITQRSFDYSKLRYGSQYVSGDFGGYYDPTNPSFENYAVYSFVYPDLNVGVYYNWQPKKRKRFSTGISIYNATSATQSFKNNPFIHLDPRFNYHADGIIQLNQRVDIMPQLLLMKQGTYYELTLGGMAKYYVSTGKYNYRALYVGIYSRAIDAAYLVLAMDYNNWHAGISYDFNYSRLVPASQGRGGWELSVSYIIPRIPNRFKYRSCPDFR